MENNIKRILSELIDYVSEMREESNTDLRNILRQLEEYKKNENYTAYPEEQKEKDWLNYPHKQSEIEFPKDEH